MSRKEPITQKDLDEIHERIDKNFYALTEHIDMEFAKLEENLLKALDERVEGLVDLIRKER